MDKKCPNCGASLPVEAGFCSECGMPCNAVTAKPGKKVKWWMIVAPIAAVVVIAVLVVGLMWNTISMRLNPIGALSKAFSNTAADMSGRGEGTLPEALSHVVDENGRYSADIDVDFDYGTYMTADVSLHGDYDLQNTQTMLTLTGKLGIMDYYNYNMDMGMYMDQECIALNWSQVTGDTYYGLAYDTFEEDILASEALKDTLDAGTRSEISEILDALSDALENYVYNEEYPLSTEYAPILFGFLKEHKGTVASEEMTLTSGKQKCDTITYSLSYQELYELMAELLDVMEKDEGMEKRISAAGEEAWEEFLDFCDEAVEELEDREGSTTLIFGLYNRRVVSVEFYEEYEDGEACLSVTLGENAGEDDIIVRFEVDALESMELEFTLSREVEEGQAAEAMTMHFTDVDGNDVDCTLSYDWDRDSGDLTVGIDLDMDGNTIRYSLDCALYEEDDGIVLELPELVGLISQLDPSLKAQLEGATLYASIAFYPGGEVTAPAYTSIRDMTQADMDNMEDNLDSEYAF